MDTFYQKKHVLSNMIGLIDDKNLDDSEVGGKIDYTRTQLVEKNRIIREVINGLGFDSMFDKQKIDRDTFEKNWAKVMNKKDLFRKRVYCFPLFGIVKEKMINRTTKSF